MSAKMAAPARAGECERGPGAAATGGVRIPAGADVRRQPPGREAPGGVFPPRKALGVLREGETGAAGARRGASRGARGGDGSGEF